jgi:hypothetical protein
MSRSRFQFKLSFLLTLAVVASVGVAFYTNLSFLSLGALVFGCCAFLLINFPRYRKQPVLICAVVGFAIASVLTFLMVLVVVIDAPVFQGQLYNEDGPEAFFLIAFIFWLIASFVAALLGMLVGVVIDVLLRSIVTAEKIDRHFV